jgi:hypothetical protein
LPDTRVLCIARYSPPSAEVVSVFENAWYLVQILLVVAIGPGIRVLPESERDAVFALGRFAGFKGPGIVLTGKGFAKWKKVKTGEQGTIINTSTVRLAAGDLPAVIDGTAKPGPLVRVTGFATKQVYVAVDFDQRRVIRCSKCGHENEIQSE